MDGSQLLHTVAATFEACRHRAMVRGPLVLLRGLSVGLLLILLLHTFITAPEPACQPPHRCPSARTFACITRDCAADRTEGCAPRGTFQNMRL